MRQAIVASVLSLLALNAFAGWFGFGGDSWKEEVLLHDGQKIIVERTQTYGGRGEIGQSIPIKTHSIRFVLPQSGRTISWKSEYGKELGRTDFNVLALHILDDMPYLVVEPNLCLAYNKWGRPNPPYVIFKHDGSSWRRIELAELPKVFENINLVVNNGRVESIKETARAKGYVSAQQVYAFNSSLTQPQYKTILKEAWPLKQVDAMCASMIHYKCGWFGAKPDGSFDKEFADRMCDR